MKVDVYYSMQDDSTMLTLLDDIEVNGWLVPKGFCSDGASIPRAFWSWCDPIDGRYLDVFVWHDWAYSEHPLPRDRIDVLMRDLLITRGMSRSKAYTIYYAVRAFGNSHY